jgi:outer membrane protein assembly factor BamB
VVYIGSLNSAVYALAASSGAMLWNFSTSSYIDYASPAVANGALYIGSDDGTFYAFGLK